MARTAGAPPAVPDHLVLAAATLADGIDYVASLTGVVAHPGGKHDWMGTHNALIKLGDKLYLEIIAVDPDARKPARPRWFGLDGVALQSELTESPRLVHWVARTSDIEAAVHATDVDVGTVHAASRGDYRWRITVRDDGALPAGGLVPSLIQWDVPVHPADRLPPSPLALVELAGSHPEPESIRRSLAALGLERALRVSFDRETRLVAMLRGPRGLVTLAG